MGVRRLNLASSSRLHNSAMVAQDFLPSSVSQRKVSEACLPQCPHCSDVGCFLGLQRSTQRTPIDSLAIVSFNFTPADLVSLFAFDSQRSIERVVSRLSSSCRFSFTSSFSLERRISLPSDTCAISPTSGFLQFVNPRSCTSTETLRRVRATDSAFEKTKEFSRQSRSAFSTCSSRIGNRAQRLRS